MILDVCSTVKLVSLTTTVVVLLCVYVGYLVACNAHTPPRHTGGGRPTGMEERGLSFLIL